MYRCKLACLVPETHTFTFRHVPSTFRARRTLGPRHKVCAMALATHGHSVVEFDILPSCAFAEMLDAYVLQFFAVQTNHGLDNRYDTHASPGRCVGIVTTLATSKSVPDSHTFNNSRLGI